MRKLTLAIAGLAALVATSVAVAHGIGGANAAAVAGTFSAAPAHVDTSTCTTTNGKTIVVTKAKYSGTATGDADLSGPITLQTHSVLNTTDNVGTVWGSFVIKTADHPDTTGNFTTVYSNGTVTGIATGRVHRPSMRLLANVSATFTPTAGFTNAKIGGGTAGGTAVELSSAPCKAKPKPVIEHTTARGSISALSTSSITVAGLSCALTTAQSPTINAKYKTGDRVEIRCAFAGGQLTLTRIAPTHHH
jgi:hypothetical protein